MKNKIVLQVFVLSFPFTIIQNQTVIHQAHVKSARSSFSMLLGRGKKSVEFKVKKRWKGQTLSLCSNQA